MYKKQRRIPTLLGLFLLIAGLSTAFYLDHNTQTTTSLAHSEATPQDVHFSNISSDSFTVSFLTEVPTSGSLIVINEKLNRTILDDLDSDNVLRPRLTHLFTVKNLSPATSYSIKVITGSKKCTTESLCPTFTQSTGPILSVFNSLPPIHGSLINKKDTPVSDAIVYLQIGKNSLLSARSDSSGLWVIPLTNVRTNDLLLRPDILDEDLAQITVKTSVSDIASAVIDIKSIKQNLAVPPVKIGNSYNFIKLATKKDFLVQSTQQQNILGSSSSTIPKNGSSSNQIQIFFPQKDFDTTPDSRPRIRGTGKAGEELLITVNSTPQSGKVKVGTDGTWTWRPEKVLPPGVHHLSISSLDKNGNLITQTRAFIVLKSGEQVLGDSTPSASLTPTATLIPSPTGVSAVSSTPVPTVFSSPTLVPAATIMDISPTTSPTSVSTNIVSPPRTGQNTSLYLLGGGASLLLLGGLFLLLP